VVSRKRIEAGATDDPDEDRHALRAGCHLSRVRSLRTQQTGLPDKHPPFAQSRRRAALGRIRPLPSGFHRKQSKRRRQYRYGNIPVISSGRSGSLEFWNTAGGLNPAGNSAVPDHDVAGFGRGVPIVLQHPKTDGGGEGQRHQGMPAWVRMAQKSEQARVGKR
jgi:hypothetical protein